MRNFELLHRRTVVHDRLDRAQYLLLRPFSDGGPMTITTLACTLGLDPATAGRQVSALTAASLVESTADLADRRRRVVTPPADGLREMRVVRDRRTESHAELLGDWGPEELRALGTMLDRYNRAVTSRYLLTPPQRQPQMPPQGRRPARERRIPPRPRPPRVTDGVPHGGSPHGRSPVTIRLITAAVSSSSGENSPSASPSHRFPVASARATASRPSPVARARRARWSPGSRVVATRPPSSSRRTSRVTCGAFTIRASASSPTRRGSGDAASTLSTARDARSTETPASRRSLLCARLPVMVYASAESAV
ncbi:DNA-binding MarR family transcriptional regulator [Streptomyces phaeogriseichromatogenes]|nr:MarR family winged helix-turn-helix transcriptional regulator [Streptomyces murinus]MBA9048046.1 DNA-binding MarR family transcriptional regulator [Streptomyces murinus]